MRELRCDLFILFLLLSISIPALSDLIITKLDRRVDLTSQIVRMTSSMKVENSGSDKVLELHLAFPDHQAKNMAVLLASTSSEGKKKGVGLAINTAEPEGMPSSLTVFSVSLPKGGLNAGESINLDVMAVYTHALKPFPEKITQPESQLVVFQDTAYFLSPYSVKVQSLTVRLPETKIESYTELENSKRTGSEIKYGPYESLKPFSYVPIAIHFVHNKPFAVAQELVREIEISHWGNVQVTEHYNLIHGGAVSTGEFSRLDYQARQHDGGASAFRSLVAKLPPRAHSIYYRDEIGNISTSNIQSDSTKTLLEIEPRYPMFGGWRTKFTIGYGLPLQDYLYKSEGKRFLDINFGCPIMEVIIDNLTVKVVLPEGSSDISVSIPFSVKESRETKFSHLDIIGRPVVVLEKTNAIPEHNQQFQVHYKFSNLSLLREPLMLIFGFFMLFVAYITYMHVDLTISKSSASYLAKLQWDEVQASLQQVLNIINRSLTIHDKLELSLRELSRSGDVQTCKAARKAAESLFKELAKELKAPLTFLHSSPQALPILPKVEDLVAKERELQEKLATKHSTIVDSYEKKSGGGGRDVENRVSLIQQKITSLRQDVDDLLEVIDEI